MGTLAFDPEQLAALAMALCATADQLEALHCADAEAQAALLTAQVAKESFESWATRVVQITGCGALDRYQPVSIDVGDLDLAAQYVLATLYGWNLRTDPVAQTWEVSPAQQASALGYLLSHGLIEVATAEQRASLLGQFEAIAADPAAQAAFAANLSAEGAATLANALAEQRAVAVSNGGGPDRGFAVDPALQDEVVAIDRIVAILADTIIGPGASVEAANAVLAGMRPYSAALVISQLDAPDEVIVDLCVLALARYHEAAVDPSAWPLPLELPDGNFQGIGDLLFPRVAQCAPAEANRFVVDVANISEGLLTATVRDPSNAAALVIHATDPATIDPASAAAVILPLIAYLRHPPASPDVPSSVFNLGNAVNGLRPYLGAVIAPWLLQFTEGDEAFGLSDDERDELITFVIADGHSFADLVAGAGEWAGALPLPDPGDDVEALQDNLERVAWAVGQLQGLLEEHHIDIAVQRQATWDLMVSLLPRAAGKTLAYSGVTGTPAKLAARVIAVAVGQGSEQAQEHGWLGAPPPLVDVLDDIEVRSDAAMAAGAYLGMVAMRSTLIASGALPPTTPEVPAPWDEDDCPSGDYVTDSTQWLDDTIPEGFARDQLEIARGKFIAPGQSSLACQRIQS
jgi:hypothetical protein